MTMTDAPRFPAPGGAAAERLALPPLIDPALAAAIRQRWADGDRAGVTALVADAMAAMAHLLRALSQGDGANEALTATIMTAEPAADTRPA